jgi:hypothetical protein
MTSEAVLPRIRRLGIWVAFEPILTLADTVMHSYMLLTTWVHGGREPPALEPILAMGRSAEPSVALPRASQWGPATGPMESSETAIGTSRVVQYSGSGVTNMSAVERCAWQDQERPRSTRLHSCQCGHEARPGSAMYVPRSGLSAN